MNSNRKKFTLLSYFSLGLIVLGIILIVSAAIFMIIKLKTTSPDILIYLMTAEPNNPLDWVFNTIVIGIFLTISGEISLIYASLRLFKNLS